MSEAPWGVDIEGQPLPEPPVVNGKPRTTDPLGLLRAGFGADAVGGFGTGTIIVTQLGPDGAPGTLRWAYDKIGSEKRVVRIAAGLTGDIVLDSPLYWKKPYCTLDGSAGDVTIVASQPATNALVFTATHNCIVYSIRGRGHFAGGGPDWVQPNNSGIFALDGDAPAVQYPWDNLWDETHPTLRRGVRSMIFDRVSVSQAEDDALNTWEACRQISFTRCLVHHSFHPSTSGAKGAPLPPYRERIWNSYLYNIAARNGERNIILPRRESYWWHVQNNIVYKWSKYISKFNGKPESNFPIGISIATQAPLENNFGWIVGNAFLGKAKGAFHHNWGCAVEALGCEDALGCCAPKCNDQSGHDFFCCNKKMRNTHWYMQQNVGDAGECVKNNPENWVPPALPYTTSVRSWAQVVAEAGPVIPNALEIALKAEILAEIANRGL